MAIEILENTLLKLLVRRGTDADRKLITLEGGELGFTTDTVRLYVGDSTTSGGVVVGNLYAGSHADITSLSPVVTGDFGYETDTNSLQVCVEGDGSSATDWLTVSNSISAGNGTIIIDSLNKIVVGTLSAGNFTADALGSSIELDSSERIALSSTINIDSITRRTADVTSYLTLPGKLKISNINYDFPVAGPGNKTYLGSNVDGTLSWTIPTIVESTVAPTTASLIPVATIVPFASAAAEVPYGWLSCDGAEYISTAFPDLSNVIGIGYNTGGETTTDYFRVPNLNNKVVYGHPDGANSTLMGVTTAAAGYSTNVMLSATGAHFIIKSIGGVTSPTLTIQKNLSAFVNSVDKTETNFNFLSGNVVIESPPPGQVVFDDGQDTHTFTMPAGIHYVKFYITGAGAKGGISPGGAGATVIGNLSAEPGTIFKVRCAAGQTVADNPVVNADFSAIYTPDGGTVLARADGGYAELDDFWQSDSSKDSWQRPSGGASGIILTSNNYILNGYVLKGGSGMMDTNSSGGAEESLGAASYWGSSPAPGGGQGAHMSNAFGAVPGNGIVMFEWS